MRVILHKKFEKQYAKLPPAVKQKFKERRNLFISDPANRLLNNHSVDSAYPGWDSINITGDFRALYELTNSYCVTFMKIGTHSQLYG